MEYLLCSIAQEITWGPSGTGLNASVKAHQDPLRLRHDRPCRLTLYSESNLTVASTSPIPAENWLSMRLATVQPDMGSVNQFAALLRTWCSAFDTSSITSYNILRIRRQANSDATPWPSAMHSHDATTKSGLRIEPPLLLRGCFKIYLHSNHSMVHKRGLWMSLTIHRRWTQRQLCTFSLRPTQPLGLSHSHAPYHQQENAYAA